MKAHKRKSRVRGAVRLVGRRLGRSQVARAEDLIKEIRRPKIQDIRTPEIGPRMEAGLLTLEYVNRQVERELRNSTADRQTLIRNLKSAKANHAKLNPGASLETDDYLRRADELAKQYES